MLNSLRPARPTSGQVRFLEGRVPTRAELDAGIALLSGNTVKAQRILDFEVGTNTSSARAASYLCAQQGCPKLAERYIDVAFATHRDVLDRFVVRLDAYCLGRYGLLFEQFRQHLATGDELSVVKNQWVVKADINNLHLIGASHEFAKVYGRRPELALAYIDLLLRHPLSAHDLSVLRSTLMVPLRKKLGETQQVN